MQNGAMHARVCLAMAVFSASSFAAFAEQTVVEYVDPNVIQYKLDNGLTVALAPSRSAQSVALVTRYNVGSSDEAPGRSGFAHLFEHLMFEGTKAVPDFDKMVSGVGGQNNAYTQRDNTTYFMTGPKEALPLFLRLDADRMANLANAVTQEDLDNQRAVVLNEMRQNVLDRPGGAAREQTDVALYPAGHPYSHSTIGSIADLKEAKLEDVIAFHRIHYIPSNAHIAITGNFEVEKAKAWINETFGKVPKSEPRAMPPVADVAAKAQRLEFVDAVATPVVSLQWPGPRGFSRSTVANSMAAGAMSVGNDALDNRLVVQEAVASSVNAYWNGADLGGTFNVIAAAAQGVSAEKLEAAMRKALDDIRAGDFTEDTLKIVRTDVETGYASAPGNPLGFAMMLVESAANGDARTWRGEVDYVKAINAEEVSAAFDAFPTSDAQVTIIKPGPRSTNYPASIANSTGTPTPEVTASRADVVIAEIALENAAAIKIPTSETRTLASGATLVTYKIDDPAKVGISITVKGGGADAPVGLADLAMSINSRGAGDLPLAELDKRHRENGISLYGGAGRHYSQIVGSSPVNNFDALAGRLADAILQPRFDDKEWAAVIDQTVSGVEAQNKSPEYQALKKLRQTLYPQGSPVLREPDVAALKALKRDDAKALFATLMRPDQTVFHVASNLSVDTIVASLDKAFAGWSANASPIAFQDYSRPTAKDIRVESQVDGATQTAILAALPAPNEGTMESIAFGLAVHTLGGDAGSRLNLVLREEKGWSYGIYASVNGDKDRNNSLVLVSTTVQSDHTEDSIAEIRKIIGELGTKPVTPEEFETARRTMKAQFLNAFDTGPGMSGFASALYTQGYALADLEKYLADLESVTLEMVNAQAKIIAQSPVALSAAGDKATMK
ncbi:MAG: M16 family metallopeptidase [Rhizobiaceae bacterium]